MGGLGLMIEMAVVPAGPAALDALHREIWEVVADRMSRLAGAPASEEILKYYLYFQESDGFADKHWLVSGDQLWYSFSDAAGNCVVEMYACSHWAQLVVLDRWAELTEVAARHDAELKTPAVDPEQQLRAILTGRSRQVFFLHYTDEDHERLGYAAADDAPDDEHELRFYALDEHVRPLSQTGADRERITGLITAGQCACDVCQELRYFRKLPQARNQY